MCSQCGTFKTSGKRSCCARGGAWFNKCGNVGDKNFHHTWVEGIHVCKGNVAGTSSGEAAVHDTLNFEKTIVRSLNSTQHRNVTRTQTTSQQPTYTTGSESHVDTTQPNVSRTQTTTSHQQQQASTYASGSESNVDTTKPNVSCTQTTTFQQQQHASTDSEGRLNLAKSAVYCSLLFIISHLQM